MNCSWVNKHISSYLDKELDDSSRGRLEAHLADCPTCSRKLEELRTVQSLFLESPQYKVSAGFNINVMAKIQEQKPEPWFLQPFLVRFAEVVTILLVISIGLASGGMLTSRLVSKQAGTTVMAGLSLESLEPLPTDSLAHAYLSVTGVRP